MVLSSAGAALLAGMLLHGGTSTTGTSTGTSGAATDGSSSTDAGTDATGGTSAGTSDGTAGDATTTAGETDAGTSSATTLDGDASASASAGEAGSSDAGVDPTFGPLDDTGTESFGVDDDLTDGCCDHEQNNSDNFLCRVTGTRPDRLAITVLLVLLGRPRRRKAVHR